MAAVNLKVCVSLIRSELAGYQGYPHTLQGEERFARALQDVTVSVEHARATLAKFKEGFPTVQNIIDTAVNLRSKFEPQVDERLEWERTYGKPKPVPVDFASVGEQVHKDMWTKLKQHFIQQPGGFPGWAKVSWKEIYAAMEQLGYPLNREQLKTIGRG